MEYTSDLVEKLLAPGELLDVKGVTVECKAVPDGQSNALDPRQLRMELAMHEEMASRKGPPPPLEVIREHMGGFNYNLNRKEIYTRYIEVPTSVGIVPVWGYYPRYGKKPRPSLVYVHGGAFFSESRLLTEEVLEKLKLCCLECIKLFAAFGVFLDLLVQCVFLLVEIL